MRGRNQLVWTATLLLVIPVASSFAPGATLPSYRRRRRERQQFPDTALSLSRTKQQVGSEYSSRSPSSIDTEKQDRSDLSDELVLLGQGFSLLRNGQVKLGGLDTLVTVEDAVMLVGLIPLTTTSLVTAFTGTFFSEQFYLVCAVVSVATGFAHWRMYETAQRDWRAPRLGEARTTYQYSAIYHTGVSEIGFYSE
jgi:hypothetical protein